MVLQVLPDVSDVLSPQASRTPVIRGSSCREDRRETGGGTASRCRPADGPPQTGPNRIRRLSLPRQMGRFGDTVVSVRRVGRLRTATDPAFGACRGAASGEPSPSTTRLVGSCDAHPVVADRIEGHALSVVPDRDAAVGCFDSVECNYNLARVGVVGVLDEFGEGDGLAGDELLAELKKKRAASTSKVSWPVFAWLPSARSAIRSSGWPSSCGDCRWRRPATEQAVGNNSPTRTRRGASCHGCFRSACRASAARHPPRIFQAGPAQVGGAARLDKQLDLSFDPV